MLFFDRSTYYIYCTVVVQKLLFSGACVVVKLRFTVSRERNVCSHESHLPPSLQSTTQSESCCVALRCVGLASVETKPPNRSRRSPLTSPPHRPLHFLMLRKLPTTIGDVTSILTTTARSTTTRESNH